MKLLLKKMSYKMLITSMIIVILSFFVVTSPSEAKLKIEKGQLYYTGTQEGKPVFEKGLWENIISALKEVADYLVGIMTLGFRMVVIGWIEIMEIVLTALLGLPMDLGKFIVDASNGMDGYSQQIVNVESIIFNEVPILNANIFDTYNVKPEDENQDQDQNKEQDEDSNSETEDKSNDSNKAGKNIESDDDANTNIIKIIRDAVAKWYYIMRLIVIAFMLIILLFIGIKMAISTVASEKALYKQMLTDWVVGMILVFSIHYIMIFVLNTNDSIVNSLKNITRDGTIIKQGLEYTFGEEDETLTDKDIEMSLYEEARTRAYDLRLTNGFTGMIIYGVLVYYAWKFTFIYFRRMINIVILVLLAPAVSASYAINKVISGKAKIFSTWFSELIMNTIIQIVHVIIYVSFVSMALEMTRQSLAGVILAFVILNFMTSADKILRQLFKLSGGSGSLAGDMADRTGISEIKNGIKSMKNAMIGGAATKAAMKATYKTAAIPVKKVGLAVAGKGTEIVLNSELYKEYQAKKDIKKYKEETKKAEEYLQDNNKMKAYEASVDKYNNKLEEYNTLKEEKQKEKEEVEALIGYYYHQGDEENLNLQLAEKDRIEQEIASKEEELTNLSKEIEKNEESLQKEFIKQQMEDASIKDVLKANLGLAFRGLVDINDNKDDENNKVYKRKKTGVQGESFRERQAKRIRFWDKDPYSVAASFKEDTKIQNLLNLTDAEIKEIKKITNFEKKRIQGLFSMIAGTPMMGINPLVGMGLLTNGMNAKLDASRRERIGNARAGTIPNSRFRFKRFGLGAMIEFSKPETYIALETQKFEALHHKKVEKQVKTELNKAKIRQKKIDNLKDNSRKIIQEYNNKMDSFEQNIRNKLQSKTAQEIAFEQKKAIGRVEEINGQYLQFEVNKEMSDFMNKIDEIDSRKDITNEEKLSFINKEIEKQKEVLIRNAIETICLEKGITDIVEVELTDKDMMDINQSIVGVLEQTGVVKKGEIDLEQDKITETTISQIYLEMVQDRDETNKNLEENIVQVSILEYMKKNKETDIKKLQTDDAKAEICDIIKEKVISDTSKQSASVIEKITGVDKLKEETALSDTMMQSLEENIKEVKKTNKMDIDESEISLSKEALIEREVNRETNKLKTELERALYTDDSIENIEDKKKQEMFELLQQLQIENQRANEIEFYLLESNKSKIEKKYKYYQLETDETEEKLNKYINSHKGQRNIQKLELQMNGPIVDINDLINNINKQK